MQTVASTGAGLAELAAEIGAHGALLDAQGGAQRRRRSRAALAVRAVVLDRLDAALTSAAVRDRLDGAAREVAEGRLDHHAAARSARGVAVRTSVGSHDRHRRIGGGAIPQRAATADTITVTTW